MGKLTKTQLVALDKLRDGKRRSAYEMQVSLATLNALQNLRLIVPVGLGHMAMPRNANWRITIAGSTVLNNE